MRHQIWQHYRPPQTSCGAACSQRSSLKIPKADGRCSLSRECEGANECGSRRWLKSIVYPDGLFKRQALRRAMPARVKSAIDRSRPDTDLTGQRGFAGLEKPDDSHRSMPDEQESGSSGEYYIARSSPHIRTNDFDLLRICNIAKLHVQWPSGIEHPAAAHVPARCRAPAELVVFKEIARSRRGRYKPRRWQ